MINKIFYSLVLFPEIRYDLILECGLKLKSVDEWDYGILHLVFSDEIKNKEISVFFCHKEISYEDKEPFNSALHTTKNWTIACEEEDVTKSISKIILKKDDKDFNFFKDADYYKAIPFGVVFSITSKCNLFCYYCFNDYDYSLEKRNKMENLSLEDIKEIIDILYASGTRDIILSGGEPFLVMNFFDILDYLTLKGFFIRINTNGSMFIGSIMERLEKYSLCLMISMHEFTGEDYYLANNKGAEKILDITLDKKIFAGKFTNKLKQIRQLNRNKSIYIDFLTILKPKNIITLEKLYDFVTKNFILNDWHFFRLYPTKRNIGIDKRLMKLAVNKIYDLNLKYETSYKIVDATPFCLIEDIDKSRRVIEGELSDGHNVKTIINSNGDIQIMSAFDITLGNIFKDDIVKVWKGDFASKMLHNGYLPSKCSDCLYKSECGGGSRMISHIFNGSYDSMDPLADLNNKIIR